MNVLLIITGYPGYCIWCVIIGEQLATVHSCTSSEQDFTPTLATVF